MALIRVPRQAPDWHPGLVRDWSDWARIEDALDARERQRARAYIDSVLVRARLPEPLKREAATPTYVQSNSGAFSAATTIGVALTGVAAGSTLVAIWMTTTTDNRNPQFTDTTSGVWSKVVQVQPDRTIRIAYAPNHASGNTTVTATWTSTTSGTMVVVELAGANTIYPVDAFDTRLDSGATGSHTCSAGLNSLGTEVMTLSGGVMNADATSTAAGTDFTAIVNTARLLVQYRAYGSGFTGETFPWTSSGTARTATNFCIAFSGLNTGRSATRIAAGDDDAEMGPTAEGKGPTTGTRTMDLVGSGSSAVANSIRIGRPSSGTGTSRVSGYRFLAPGMANAATISYAALILESSDTYTSGALDVVVSCQDADSPTTFTSTAGNLDATARPRTGGTTVGTSDSGSVSMSTQIAQLEQRIVCTSAVQAVVNRAGYTSSSNIACLLDILATSVSSDWQEVYSYNANTTKCAKLLVYFTNPAAGGSLVLPRRNAAQYGAFF